MGALSGLSQMDDRKSHRYTNPRYAHFHRMHAAKGGTHMVQLEHHYCGTADAASASAAAFAAAIFAAAAAAAAAARAAASRSRAP